jgi:GT2 family glycosyltransferase
VNKVYSHCVAIPFYNRFEQVKNCLDKLLKQALPETKILLVDDGSTSEFDITPYSNYPVFMVKHDKNRGIGAARNTIINWCNNNAIEVVIMIDSDCAPESNFITEHVRLHKENPSAACIGGGIVGCGKGFWAKMDRLMSWVHSIPTGELKVVKDPYLLPGTNISFKISALSNKEKPFNDRLLTGEDALLIRELREEGKVIMFSPSPVIYHNDRDTLPDVIKHTYLWGGHLYLIQFGNNFSPCCLRLYYRIPFFIFFFFAFPFFSILGSILTLKPWLKQKANYVVYYPILFFLWLVKSMAVFRIVISPKKHLLY